MQLCVRAGCTGGATVINSILDRKFSAVLNDTAEKIAARKVFFAAKKMC
jgi:hypothetical protein